MSDDDRDQLERQDEKGAFEDVEAHGFTQPKEEPLPYDTEEPPDVEGHAMGQPHYAPKDLPKD